MLRNRKEVTEPKLRGVNRAADPMKIKLGTFVELANFIQGKRWKLKKKRGVEELNTDAVTITATPCITSIPCTDSDSRGQAEITIETRFVQTGTRPSSFGGLRTSWGYISPDEEVYTLIGDSGCAGGNMFYATCSQINHYTNPSTLNIIDPPFETSPDLPGFYKLGTSDEPIYCPVVGSANTAFYPNSQTRVEYDLPAGLINTSVEAIFAKRDTSFYLICHDVVFPNFFAHIVEYDAETGVQILDLDLGVNATLLQMSLTATYLYVLMYETSEGSQNPKIQKRLRSDLSLVAEFYLDNLQPNSIGVVDDTLLYVLGAGDRATLYYIENFTDLFYVGYTGSLGFSPYGPANGMFVNGAFYYGSTGFGTGSVDIYKVSVGCPELGPLVPSFTLSSETVAAGDDITVTWADVLIPNTADTILLYPAPAPGRIGFELGGQLAYMSADGNADGFVTFTIPMATPPGDYVFFYSGPGFDIMIARSDVFTVT